MTEAPFRSDVTVTREGASSFPLTIVTTPTLRLVFAPTHGGHLLALSVHGREVLWQNPILLDGLLRPRLPIAAWPAGDGDMSTWANVGRSKTWPAPQGWAGPEQWPGPPDLILDAGRWTLEVTHLADTGVRIDMLSPDDDRSGLRIGRSFTIPATGYRFRQTTMFTNVSARDVRWSIWQVCQVETSRSANTATTSPVVVVPLAADGVVVDLGTYDGTPDVATVRDRDGKRAELTIGRAVAKRIRQCSRDGHIPGRGWGDLDAGLGSGPRCRLPRWRLAGGGLDAIPHG